MILQCDQCNTKFRLDDSKLKPGGVKVRCSKCRHVFVAGAETKQEESEFDLLLSGLGAPAAQMSEPTPPPASAVDTSGFGDEADASGAGVSGALPQGEVSTSAGPVAPGAETVQPSPEDSAAFDFSEPVPETSGATSAGEFEFSEPALAPTAAAPEAPTAESGLDFSEFSFEDEPVAAPVTAAEGHGTEFDFSDFDLGASDAGLSQESVPASPEVAAPEPVGKPATASQDAHADLEGLDFGDFSFTEEGGREGEPSASTAPGEPATAAAFDFGAFNFSEEPPPLQETAGKAQEDFDLSDFNFSDTPVQAEEKSEPAEEELGFGEFSFSEEPLQPQAEPEQPKDEFELGDFDFSEEPPAAPAAGGAAKDEFDFSEFNFEEPAEAGRDTVATKEQPESDSESEFTFDDEPLAPAAAPAAAAVSEVPPLPKAAAESPAVGANFDLKEFSFSDEAPAKAAAPAEAASGKGPAAPDRDHLGPLTGFAAALQNAPESESGRRGAAAAGEPSLFPPDEQAEEELPPLSISSRRKGRSFLALSVVAVSVLVILVLSATGLYFLQGGPAAFDKLGLGFVTQWFGMENPDEGRITIKNPQASFLQNKEAGELFVVTGEAVNNFRKARASIHVRVSLFDKKGAVILQKTAYCGNRISNEQLASLPFAKIDSIMNNQFGDSLSNLGVQPGGSIRFVVAIPNVPKEAADFGVDVVGSTVGGK